MKIKNIYLGLLTLIFMLLLFPQKVFASGFTDIGDTVDTFKFTNSTESGLMDKTMHLDTGQKETESDFWNKIYSEYKGIILGISGIALLTFVMMFIVSFMRLAKSAGNPQERKQAQMALLWTGIGAALSGSVFMWVGFAYNLLK